jgi:predicted dehydrogenase
MGSGHADNLINGKVPGGELAAVCDIDPAKLDWAKEQFPNAKFFASTDEMFTSGAVDAVVIATPHYAHPTIAIEAFKHKLHVMCEKPAGVYTKAVREMNEAAKNSNVVFGIMYNQRTNPMFRKMREMVQGGELGEIKRTSWLITDWYRPQAYYNSGGWRATWDGEGGGVLLNQCPHNLDLWQWICGMPSKVTAFTHEGKWHTIEVEDDVTAYVEYANGATGVFVTSTADAPGDNRFEVLGDKGKLVYEKGKLTYSKLETPERVFNAENKIPFGSPKAEAVEVECPGTETSHSGVLAAFVEKIGGKGELIARGEEGINGLTISNAMHLSSWQGKTVELPLDEDLFYAELQKKIAKAR